MLSLDAWRAGGHFFDWRGEKIFCRVQGEGPPLLLIHGFPTSSWDYWPLWERLAARRRVLTLDMLGFGLSAKPRGFAYSIAAQADLLTTFLAQQGVQRYQVLAHDYGDTVAQELLARQSEGAPARIERVCLLNGGLFPETHHALFIQKVLASPLGPALARLSSRRSFTASLRRICVHPLSDSELATMWQLASQHDGMAVMPKLIGYMAERRIHRERWVGALVRAQVPVRLIDGIADPVSGQHMVARYRQLVPHPDVVELSGVGHYPQLEAPDAVLCAVEEFLTRAH